MRNPICEAMGWPVPTDKQVLVISENGRPFASLTSAKGYNLEGVYLLHTGIGVPNACYSVVGDRSEHQIKSGLAQKLFANGRTLKAGEMPRLIERLASITVAIE